jgi:hypothetical protein
MGERKEGILSGITVKAIALGVILALFNIWIVQTMNTMSIYYIAPFIVGDNLYGDTNLSVRLMARFFLPLGIMVWACIVMLLINRARPGTFSLQEVATVFMIVFAAGYLGYDISLYGQGDTQMSITSLSAGFVHYVSDPEQQAELFAMLPSLWPQKAVTEYTVNNIMIPNTGVFSIFMPYWGGLFAWRWIYNLGGIFMFVGIATLLRRQLVEVEALSFPFATLATEVVKISQPGTSKVGNIIKNKWFLIGFIMMALWSIIPMAPVFLTNRGNRDFQRNGWYWLNPYRQPAWVAGTIYPLLDAGSNFAYNLWPFFIGFCYLWPIGELAGGLVGFGIFFLWMAMALTSGIQWIYQSKLTGVWGSSIGNPLHLLLDRWFAVEFGFLLALVVIPAIRHRKLLLDSLKGIFEEPEDPDKPVTYRTAWLILIAGFVLWVIAGALFGVHVGAWILFLIVCGVLATGLIRVVSANGGWLFNSWKTMWDASWFSYIGLPILFMFGVTAADGTTLKSWYMMVEGDICRVLWGAVIAANLLLAFYKFGKLTKTKEKNVLIGGTIGLVISAIFVIVFCAMLQEYMASTMSWTLGVSGNYWSGFWTRLKTEGFSTFFETGKGGAELVQAPEYWLAAVVIGFIIIAVFSLLRQRYSWFIVSATGVFTGAMFGSLIWLPMLLAIILKYLTLRLGGIQKYEDAGKPMAVGTLAGTAFIFVIQTLIWYLNRIAVGAAYPA